MTPWSIGSAAPAGSGKDRLLIAAARLGLASAFLVSAFLKITDFTGAQAEVRALAGLEPAALFASLVIATQATGGILLLCGGWWTAAGAALLAAFTLVATVLGHPFWSVEGVQRVRDLTTFCEHLGLIGGLGLAALLSLRRSDL